MCVDKDQSRARPPVPEKSLLNVVGGKVTSLKNTALEEDHRCSALMDCDTGA